MKYIFAFIAFLTYNLDMCKYLIRVTDTYHIIRLAKEKR